MILTEKEKDILTKVLAAKICDLEKVEASMLGNVSAEAYRLLESKRNMLIEDIRRTEGQLLGAVIAPEAVQDSVRVGDILKLSMDYGDGGLVEDYYRLTFEINMSDTVTNISVNSPVGRAIFDKPVGSIIEQNGIIINIVSKITEEELKSDLNGVSR